MNTIVALPDGKLVLTLHGTAHTVTRIEHDSFFSVTSCKIDPPNQEVEDLISDNIAEHHKLSQQALERSLKKLKRPNKA